MQVDRYYAGFNLGRLGTLSFDVTADSNTDAYTVTLTSGGYYHDLADGAGYVSLASALESALNAAAPVVTWTVTWSNATLAYTITDGGGAFAATLNAVAQNTLGMAASLSASASQVSTVQPYYVIAPSIDAISRSSGDYEPNEGIVSAAMTLNGQQFGVGVITRPTYHDWTQMLEALEATQDYAATASVPWTWRHFFDHVGVWEPFVLIASTSASILYESDAVMRCKLRPDGAAFQPDRHEADLDSWWDVPFQCVVEDRP